MKASLVAGAASIFLLLTTLIVFRKVDGRSPLEMGLRFDGLDLLYSLILLLAGSALAYGMVRRFGHAAPSGVVTDESRRAPVGSFPMMLMVLAMFLSAWQEEVLFRGYLSATLHPIGTVGVILLGAALFSLVHLVTGPITLWRALSWLIFGVALGLVYQFSGSIWTATMIHAIRSLVNFFLISGTPGLALIRPERTIAEPVRTGYHLLFAAAAVALLVLLYGADGGALAGPVHLP